jgi:hypothetical protein
MDWIDELFEEADGNEFVPISMVNYLESALEASAIDCGEYTGIMEELLEPLSWERYKEIYKRINEMQTCPIASGRNYSQGDIVRKLRNEI